MTEEFDALLRFDPVRAIAFAVGVLLLGIVLELALRYFERRAIANYRCIHYKTQGSAIRVRWLNKF